MKITVVLLILLVLFSPISPAQDYAQMGLPDGAVARFGKGWVNSIVFSPDITRVALSCPIGVWLYDTATGQEVDLLTGQPDWVHKRNVQFGWQDTCQRECGQRVPVGCLDR